MAELDLSSLGSFDFTPAWAKKEEKVSVAAGRGGAREGGAGGFERPDRGSSFPRNGGERKGGFGDKKPFGDRKSFGDRKPFGDRKGFDRRPRFEDRPKPLDVEVKILPETKALGTIIRKLQGDFHAYKLKDLAFFFLDNPSSILLKVTPRHPADGGAQPAPLGFFQCKVCGFASNKEEEVVEHIVSAHIGDYFDSKEVEVEPPKGNFNCVAKCGLSGVLLGPPNIHEFNAVVREMIRTKYPDMSEAEYRSRIEMVRDAEQIEEWRKSATKRTMFFAKGTAEQEGAQQYTREQAEGEFRRNFLAAMLDKPKHLMITAEQAMKSPVKPLQWAVKDAIQAERRAPYAMIFALRGAFHHRKLNFFRANDARGPEFVINSELKEFDAEHAIPELASAAKFLAANPCLDKNEFPADIAEFEKHLNWLVSTGHAVAFTNGVFSMAEKFPKYGPQWKKRSGAAKAETPAAEAPAAVAETNAANEVSEVSVEEGKKDETAAQLAE